MWWENFAIVKGVILVPRPTILFFERRSRRKEKVPKRGDRPMLSWSTSSPGDEGQPTSGLRPDHWFQIIWQQCAPAKITNMCLKNICVDIASFDSFSHLFKRNESLPNFEALIALVGVWRENQRRLHISSNTFQSSDQTQGCPKCPPLLCCWP